MIQKICTKCKKLLSLDKFNKNKVYYKSRCKKCTQEDEKEYRQKYPEKEKLKKLKYNTKNKEKVLEQRKLYARKYRRENKYKVNALNRMRKYQKILRTPKWIDNEEKWLIQEAYHLAQLRTELTKIEWHVDHIIPIKGKLVSGLHVIENLQVIPEYINLKKSNKFLESEL